MVKSIVIDELASQKLQSILLESSSAPKTGLLIGVVRPDCSIPDIWNISDNIKHQQKMDKTSDYIIHVVSTPPGGQGNDSLKSSSPTTTTAAAAATAASSVDVEWILNHALQVKIRFPLYNLDKRVQQQKYR